jgi:phage shock protein PspC (stress-responsive transcriptional regulator)
MLRSFTDRLLAGVCGGIASALRMPSWLIRAVFVVLTLASFGLFALLYILLWWLIPQETYVQKRRGALPVFAFLVLLTLTIGLWIGRDSRWLQAASGESLVLPIIGLVLAFAYFMRQVSA